MDVLAGGSAALSLYDSNVVWIRDKLIELSTTFPGLTQVHIREFFYTRNDADSYACTVPYPTDGTVVVSVNGTDRKKVKPTKSVELRVTGEGYLVSKEGTELMRLASKHRYTEGCIVEVRFSVDSSGFHIHGHFKRFDRLSPDSDSAVSSVVTSFFEPDSDSDSVVRTPLWRGSNNVRF